jgi:hypothetical protein
MTVAWILFAVLNAGIFANGGAEASKSALHVPAGTEIARDADAAVEAEVYRAALAGMSFGSEGSVTRRHALIASTTDPGAMWRSLDEATIRDAPYLDPKHRIRYAKAETIDAFLAAIDTQKPLPAALRSLPQFFIIDRRDVLAMNARKEWAAFRRRHGLSNTVVELSRIGFDAAGSQALLSITYNCGMLCGGGAFILVERQTDGWHVTKVDLYYES